LFRSGALASKMTVSHVYKVGKGCGGSFQFFSTVRLKCLHERVENFPWTKQSKEQTDSF
jgi:hypothetical protein